MRRLLVLALLCGGLWGCGGKNVDANAPKIEEPDRDLYVRATHDLARNRFITSRLLLQTLINTYPDSEFLPQAKYAMAESFYKENTHAALNQSELEFKDYITFFPTSDLADDAQLKVAMTHVRQMERSDRDPTQARLAEVEFLNMIRSYPDSPLLDEAKDKLRGVQEVLADGIYGIARQYFLRKAYLAAINRFREVLDKYPDYTRADETLYYLAESLRRNNNAAESGDYYAQIISDYPRSELGKDARLRLTEMKRPIPEPNPVALARAQQAPEERGVFGKVWNTFFHKPEVPSDTKAASVADDSLKTPDQNPGAAPQGASGSVGAPASGGGNSGSGVTAGPAPR